MHNSQSGIFTKKLVNSQFVQVILILTLAIEASWIEDSMNLRIIFSWVVTEAHVCDFLEFSFLDEIKSPTHPQVQGALLNRTMNEIYPTRIVIFVKLLNENLFYEASKGLNVAS